MQNQQKLTFKDGTVFNGRASESAYGIYLYIEGQTVNEVVSILSDSEKTSRIEYECNSAVIVYEGYTEIFSIGKTGEAVSAILQKGGVNDGNN